MDLTAMCYYAKDFPREKYPHIIIVALDNGIDVILVPISSIKNNKYYDKACVISPDEIVSKEGRNILNKESFIRYQWALKSSQKKIFEKQKQGVYEIRCKISNHLIQRIKDGALTSAEIEPIYRKYFDKHNH